jgi:hypothetical protein
MTTAPSGSVPRISQPNLFNDSEADEFALSSLSYISRVIWDDHKNSLPFIRRMA